MLQSGDKMVPADKLFTMLIRHVITTVKSYPIGVDLY
jgi:hypothetical protein